MLLLTDIEKSLNELEIISKKLKIEDKQEYIKKVETKLESGELSFQNSDYIASVKQKDAFLKIISQYSDYLKNLTDIKELFEISNDEERLELEKMFVILDKKIQELKLFSMFDGNNDICDCYLEIICGAGGVDSQDCAEMIMKMYQNYAKFKNFNCSVVDIDKSDEAGIKSCNMLIKGDYAYGLLKRETGTHRIVRISPFNANAKRQTSFVNIFCYPKIETKITVQINDKDLRIDTFRSSGAGGQHVNTTDSAIRITHIPTGLVSQSQSSRSQISNKEEAMKMMLFKLQSLEQERINSEKKKNEEVKTDASFGNQIRNYVMDPYKMIKDLRTGFETQNINKILSGEMDELIWDLIKNT